MDKPIIKALVGMRRVGKSTKIGTLDWNDQYNLKTRRIRLKRAKMKGR